MLPVLSLFVVRFRLIGVSLAFSWSLLRILGRWRCPRDVLPNWACTHSTTSLETRSETRSAVQTCPLYMHVPVSKKSRSALVRALFRWRGCTSLAPSLLIGKLSACASIAAGHCEALTTRVSCGQPHDKHCNKRSRDLRPRLTNKQLHCFRLVRSGL